MKVSVNALKVNIPQKKYNLVEGVEVRGGDLIVESGQFLISAKTHKFVGSLLYPQVCRVRPCIVRRTFSNSL